MLLRKRLGWCALCCFVPNLMASEIPVERYAKLALDCVHLEYPNKIGHTLASDDDVGPPRELTPVFYGCFDWHSAVHGHWLLARLARLNPEAELAEAARTALAKSFQPDKVAAEIEYLNADGRDSFERPYGLAWLLQLGAELREWDEAQEWSTTLGPLEEVAADKFREWLPKLTYPIRTGEHSQTAFAFGLVLDWARAKRDRQMEELLVSRIRELYLADLDCPVSYEPGGQDFLSPCLAEADLVRRILSVDEFATWLSGFLPGIPSSEASDWLEIARVSDRSDGKLAHLDGLNLSRAWMLEGIAAGLPDTDGRQAALFAAASAHAGAGLRSVTGEHYAGGHWLGSFAVYLVTKRGI